MKKNARKRATVLSLAMAAMLALPTMASAQESRSNYGGIFGTNPSAENANKEHGLLNGNRDTNAGITIGGMQQENPSPIGSGLFVLAAAGAGYVFVKSRKKQK